MNKILFICSGNYYRSRFAEEYFNHLAEKHQLNWAASSKGLSQNMPSPNNPGPISANTLEALRIRNIEGKDLKRFPQPLDGTDFNQHQRFIALSELEHRPILEERFVDYINEIEYFEVGDLPLEEPKPAMDKIARLVDKLVAELLVNKRVA